MTDRATLGSFWSDRRAQSRLGGLMGRRSVIAVTAVLAFAAMVAPIGGALWYSWHVTVDWEHSELRGVADRATIRAHLSIEEATDTLRSANAIDDVVPCSAEHIRRMEVLAFDASVVEEIGYFHDGLLRCTSWGPVDSKIEHVDTFDFTTADGVKVTALMHPRVTGGKSKMALELGSYNVLVDPGRFADIIVDDDTSVTIAAPNGQIVSALHNPGTNAMTRVTAGSNAGINDAYVYAASRANGWIAVASVPRAVFDHKLSDQRRVLVPIGVGVAIIPVALVVLLSRRRLSLRGELATAARKREFFVNYQPLIDLATSRCVGAEALVRWQRADGVLVRPDLFIPLAEETGVIEAITDQVIEAVGRDLGAFLAADRSMHVAVNLCAKDVGSGRAFDVVTRVCNQHDINPEQLWLEMTEQGLVDIDAARPQLERAHRAGHRVAIDDFGTGYSSLSHLQQLPLDILKIDKSFVDTIGTESATSAVTSHIIDMAKALHLEIVAEGVETIEQAEYLALRGVEFAQGWLYSKALPAEAFKAYCNTQSAVARSAAGAIVV